MTEKYVHFNQESLHTVDSARGSQTSSIEVDLDSVRLTSPREKKIDYETAKATQREAFKTYAENIHFIKKREKSEKLTEMIEKFQGDHLSLKLAKVQYGLAKAADIAMWVPGLDVLGESIREKASSHNINKTRKHRYRSQNGTLFGSKSKGYEKKISSANNYENKYLHKKRKIIQDFEDLLIRN